MGFLTDEKLADVNIDGVPPGVYPAEIVASKLMHPGGDESRTSWQVSYRIDPEHDEGGQWVSEWFEMGLPDGDKRKPFLKRRLASLEIPEAGWDDMEPSDILGLEVIITVKHTPAKDGSRVYVNVTNVKVGHMDVTSGDDLF